MNDPTLDERARQAGPSERADLTGRSLRIRTWQARPSENGPHGSAEVGEAKTRTVHAIKKTNHPGWPFLTSCRVISRETWERRRSVGGVEDVGSSGLPMISVSDSAGRPSVNRGDHTGDFLSGGTNRWT